MADDWRDVVLEELAAPVRNALVGGPFGSDLVSADYSSTGVPVIRGENLSAGRWVAGEFVFVPPAKAEHLSANTAGPLDIVFTQRGANHYRQVAIVPVDANRRFVISQSQMKLTVDREKADPLFVYYQFRSPLQQEYLQRHAIQTGVPHTNLSILRKVPLRVPSLQTQRTIARILGTLDDKIELNRRMNETLGAMTRAIFKSWFVDFDPVRAKVEGRNPELPKRIADLFPDRFEDSELGEIPAGWAISSIGQVADVIDCLHSKKPDRRENGLPLLQLVNIRDDGLIDMQDTYFINEADYSKWISRMEAKPGDCVVTNVGRVGAVAQMPSGQRAALGRNMTGVRCKSRFSFPTFLIECLLSQAMRDEIVHKMDSGTILDALNVRNIPKLRFTYSLNAIIAQFENRVRPVRAQMERHLAESRTLAAVRDTLLPKLISGELRVKDAESFLEPQL